MAIKPKQSDKKKRKKHWYSIVAPKQFHSNPLGEAPAYQSQDLVGKVVKANLMSLTNDPKKQSITVTFRVIETVNDTCQTDLVTYAINNAHIKRLVRKSTNKLEDSFLVKSKDGVAFRIKPILLTRYRANNSVLTVIRKKTQEAITSYFSQTESHQCFADVITNKLQMETKKMLKKVYPISICEIKTLNKIVPKQQP